MLACHLHLQADLGIVKEKQSAAEKALSAANAKAAEALFDEKKHSDEKLEALKQEKEAAEAARAKAAADVMPLKQRADELETRVKQLETLLAAERHKSAQRLVKVAANILASEPGVRSDDDDLDSVEMEAKPEIDQLILSSKFEPEESAVPGGDDTAEAQRVADLEAKLLALERQLAAEETDRLARESLEREAAAALALRDDVTPAAAPPASAALAGRLRDYSVLVDASSSMRLVDRGTYGGRSRWALAREALELIVPQVVARDEDGISLYFFSTGYKKFTHVNSAEVVRWNFNVVGTPKGGTQLTEALEDAVIPDNRGRPETILIITDGAPENRRSVEAVIKAASNKIQDEDDLRIVFVQVQASL